MLVVSWRQCENAKQKAESPSQILTPERRLASSSESFLSCAFVVLLAACLNYSLRLMVYQGQTHGSFCSAILSALILEAKMSKVQEEISRNNRKTYKSGSEALTFSAGSCFDPTATSSSNFSSSLSISSSSSSSSSCRSLLVI